MSYDLNRTRQRELMGVVLAGIPDIEQILNGRTGTGAFEEATHQAARTTAVDAEAVALINRAGDAVALSDPRAILPADLGSLMEVRAVMNGGGTDGGLHIEDGIALFTATSPVRSSQELIIGAILVAEVIDETALQEWRGEIGADLVVFRDGVAMASTLEGDEANAWTQGLLVRVSSNPGEFFGGEHRPGPIVIEDAPEGPVAMVAARFRDPFDGLPADDLGVLIVAQTAPSQGGVIAQLRVAQETSGARFWIILGLALVALFGGWFLIDLDTRRRGGQVVAGAPVTSALEAPPDSANESASDDDAILSTRSRRVDELQIPTRPRVASPPQPVEEENVRRHAESNDEIDAVLRPSRAAELSAEVEAVLRADDGPLTGDSDEQADADDPESASADIPNSVAKVLRPKKQDSSVVSTPDTAPDLSEDNPWEGSGLGATTKPQAPPVNEVERVFSPWAESEDGSDHKSPPHGTSPAILLPDAEGRAAGGAADPKTTITADEMAMIDDSGLYRASMIPNALRALEPTQPGWQDASVSNRPKLSGEGTEQIAWKNLEAALELPDPLSGSKAENGPEESEEREEDEDRPLFDSAEHAKLPEDDDPPFAEETPPPNEEVLPFESGEGPPPFDDSALGRFDVDQTSDDDDDEEEEIEPPLEPSTPIGGYPSLYEDPAGTWTNPAKKGASSAFPAKPNPAGLTEPTPVCLSEALNEQEPFYVLFREFIDTRERCGESVSKVSFDSFRRKLEKTEAAVKGRFGCPDVRFEIYVKNERAAIKATPTH